MLHYFHRLTLHPHQDLTSDRLCEESVTVDTVQVPYCSSNLVF